MIIPRHGILHHDKTTCARTVSQAGPHKLNSEGRHTHRRGGHAPHEDSTSASISTSMPFRPPPYPRRRCLFLLRRSCTGKLRPPGVESLAPSWRLLPPLQTMVALPKHCLALFIGGRHWCDYRAAASVTAQHCFRPSFVFSATSASRTAHPPPAPDLCSLGRLCCGLDLMPQHASSRQILR